MPLELFHPVLKDWFQENLGEPTEAQNQAWPSIQKGVHTLISAPTGSGKTLAAFYAVIDKLVKEAVSGQLLPECRVVYISPLKALSNDIRKNLDVPLAGIKERFDGEINISVGVRTGDTSQKERQAMVKNPPHILVTTPESLYILLTSESGRNMLSSVDTIITDEIHALLGDKRGSHLALSIERLEALTNNPLHRIGLSATQKPIEMVAKFLVGNNSDENDCNIVNTGHKRKLDLSIEVPKSPLSAVMPLEVWGEIYERLVQLINEHKTTLIFVNQRRMAERLSLALSEKMGDEYVTCHHGSMSKEHRFEAEQKLKKGELKVLVATASMELGIDIGSVELVVQFASPLSIAAFLQRVGRSGHYVGGVPKGILFPLTIDELVECTALLDAVRRGELDKIVMPEAPLDILSQQIVAEVSAREWNTDDLFKVITNAYPFRSIKRERFVEIVRMLADGFTTRRGRGGAYLHYDAINEIIKPRKNARLTALTSGGSIPDMFDFDVILEPENIKVGTVNEEFALESLPGDIFTLGTHSWQLLRVDGLTVRVKDAAGIPPSIPIWFGEGPSRTKELSESVSRLRTDISLLLKDDPLVTDISISANEGLEGLKVLHDNKVVDYLQKEIFLSKSAAEQVAIFLSAGEKALQVMPSRDTIVMERFFDETGDMHLVIHSPYGSRVNKGWGLALRKKFCRNFNFELQAAANEDAIIISLSSNHSFPLDDVFRYLNTKIVRETLIQAMLDAPLFEVRWRWNATRSLAVLRNRAGKKVPPQFQRMNSEDLIAQVFPDQIACFENIDGEREVPEHPLVDQTIHDCLTEAMDIDELEELIGKIERNEVELVAKDLREPSPFAAGIINAKPYAFLDETEFAERRTNAIKNRRWLDPNEVDDLSKLDVEAINNVRQEAWPLSRDAEELHDALMIMGFMTAEEGESSGYNTFFLDLMNQRRAVQLINQNKVLWLATERISYFKTIFDNVTIKPEFELPEILNQPIEKEKALIEITRGRLEVSAVTNAVELSSNLGIEKSEQELALLALENEGFVFRGRFTPGFDGEEWCERRLLQRIHKYTLEGLRQSIQPVSVQDYMRFLFKLHRFDEKPTGPESLMKVLDDLEGFEAPAAAWETEIIPARISDYDPSWLDVLCMAGKIRWNRFDTPKSVNKTTKSPVKSTPIALIDRTNSFLWKTISFKKSVEQEFSSTTESVYQDLMQNGASFFDDLVQRTKLLKAQVEKSLAELTYYGLVSSDSYTGLRALLTPEYNKPSENGRRRRKASFGIEHSGRWEINKFDDFDEKVKLNFEYLEKLVFIYLKRYGVIFRNVLEKESLVPPWRVLIRVLKRLEMQGKLRGGRFIAGVSGEQFAKVETIDQLRKVRKEKKNEDLIVLSAADPINLLGTVILTAKIQHHTNNRILFRDGLPIVLLQGKKFDWLVDLSSEQKWEYQKIITERSFPQKLRYYLGKNYKG